MTLRIGITMRVVESNIYSERRNALSVAWSEYLTGLFPEALVIPLPNKADNVENMIGKLNITGIILSNGNDWGEAPERDETERQIVNYCIRRDLPVFGVCRGLQAINILFGGTLEVNMESRIKETHVTEKHEIKIVCKPFDRWSNNEKIFVNSFHKQGVLVEGLSKELKAFAIAGSGVVEGLFHPQKPFLAVQWHPERKSPSSSYDRLLITRFFEGGIFWN
jgi:putative glutamine amidotransferase